METLHILAGHVKIFTNADDAAVTVDYVVLLGAIIMLGLAIAGTVALGTMNYSSDVSDYLEAVEAGNASNGNPGNDKNVGNAGETPNGGDDWGSGSKGKSE